MIDTAELKSRVGREFPALVDDLRALVAIPSISADGYDPSEVRRSAEQVRALFQGAGLDAQVLASSGPGLPTSRPAVVARGPRRPGAPTVLLYAHHDVQPVDRARWSLDPFHAELRGDRLYGRGASDDGAGIAVHVGALRALGDDLRVNVRVFVEGEEEVGSPAFASFLAAYADRLRSDVIVVADSGNWAPGIPAVTASLRGEAECTVRVRVLAHAVHSGSFGGPVLDAVTLAARLIATLHDERGDVAVVGIPASHASDLPYDEAALRSDASAVATYRLAGSGPLAARLWDRPALNVTGFDARPVAHASNTIAPECTFRLSLRTPPEADPQAALAALERHLRAHAPFGAEVALTPGPTGPGYRADLDAAPLRDLHWALAEAWGRDAVDMGQGGSIPFIADFQRAFPGAHILVTGVEDPLSNAHSEDESQSLPDLRHAVEAEALLLTRLGRAGEVSAA